MIWRHKAMLVSSHTSWIYSTTSNHGGWRCLFIDRGRALISGHLFPKNQKTEIECHCVDGCPHKSKLWQWRNLMRSVNLSNLTSTKFSNTLPVPIAIQDPYKGRHGRNHDSLMLVQPWSYKKGTYHMIMKISRPSRTLSVFFEIPCTLSLLKWTFLTCRPNS